jgi:hypothetical protein
MLSVIMLKAVMLNIVAQNTRLEMRVEGSNLPLPKLEGQNKKENLHLSL